MIKNILLTSALAITTLFCGAQTPAAKGNVLKFKVNGLKDTTVFLANYYGNKLYYADTTKANAKGEFQFSTKKKFAPGLYAVVVCGKYFELVLNNENINMESDKANLIDKVVVKESKENKLFYDYITFINSKRKLADPLRESGKAMKKDDPKIKDIKDKLAALDKEVKAYQLKFITENPTSLAAKYIKLSLEIDMPAEGPKDANGKLIDTLWAYKYAKAHYFDNLDMSDDRMVNAPFFHNKIDAYFKNMVIQIPDTMIAEIDRLLPKLTSKEQFKYVCHKLTYESETSKIMCFDKVFVHLINKFYKTGKVTWLKEDKMKAVIERADEIAPCICGIGATPITLPDSSMQWKKLYDVKADYTILVFWDPECGHCKTELPKFAELMKKYKDKGIAVYSVSQDHSAAWKKFIRDNKMTDFINVAVPKDVYEKGQEKAHEYVRKGLTDYPSLNYRNYYDIVSTPRIFLLDKNKVIVAKQLEAEQMDKIIEHFLKQGKKW